MTTKRRIGLIAGVLALLITAVATAATVFDTWDDDAAVRIKDPQTGIGGRNVTKLGAMQRRAFYSTAAASGLLEVADTTELVALLKADLAATVALPGVTSLRVRVLDSDGDGNPRIWRWVPGSSATTTAFVLAAGEGGTGRWIASDYGADITDGAVLHTDAATNPTAESDEDNGYLAGWTWRNNITGEEFRCVSAADGNAVWKTTRPAVYSFANAAGEKRITATDAKTTPSGLTAYILADVLNGARIRASAQFKVVGSNGTDTGAFSIETSNGAVLAALAAFNLTDNDTVTVSGEWTVEQGGAGGVISGLRQAYVTGGTPTTGPLLDISVDLSTFRTIKPYVQLSTTNAGNIVDVRRFDVEVWTSP